MNLPTDGGFFYLPKLPMWKKVIYYVMLGVALCATTLVLSELLLRASARVPTEDIHTISEKYFGLIPGPFEPGQNILVKPHPKLIHHVSINSLGYRGPEISSKKKPGTVRILCLGDSGTYGHYVNDNETFPFYLQQRFAQEQLPVEVINAGVPDTTIVDQFYYLKRSIEIEPDIVILTFSENDIVDLAKETPTYLALEENRKLKSSGVAGILYRVVRDTALLNFGLLLKAKLAAMGFEKNARASESSPNAADRYEKLWKVYEEYLGQIKGYLEQRQISFIFNVFPTHHRINKDTVISGPMAEQLDRVERLAGGMGIPTISILQQFQSGKLGIDELYLLPYDGHASKKGYLIQANTVFEFIRNDVVKILSTR